MSKGRILVVEDHVDTARLLEHYFGNQDYDVDVVGRGDDALKTAQRILPDLIVLDIILPDMNGYTVCRALRTTPRTSHIPIIFLTQRDRRSDKIAGLELGADDYVTKPFDMEELGLRVKNAIQSHQRLNMTDPSTGLPAGPLIEDQLRKLMAKDGWTYIEISIVHIRPFRDTYGIVAANEVLRHTGLLLNDVVSRFGTAEDFIGHANGATFVLITYTDAVDRLLAAVRRRFEASVDAHYSFLDTEQAGVRLADDTLAPLMDLSVGVVSSAAHSFVDIREVTEAAAEMRARNDKSNVR
ncbi:MAG: response regulator [Candidatus Promineifilaceae bacterium]|nr:response regulator [Candidatus Promineifilaceae bacterium]